MGKTGQNRSPAAAGSGSPRSRRRQGRVIALGVLGPNPGKGLLSTISLRYRTAVIGDDDAALHHRRVETG